MCQNFKLASDFLLQPTVPVSVLLLEAGDVLDVYSY